MRVLINTLPLYGKGAGLRTYTEGLLRSLRASNADLEWSVPLREADAERLELLDDTRFHLLRSAAPARLASLPGARFASRNAVEHLLLPALGGRYDVVHYLDSYGPSVSLGRTPLALTVHDLLPLTSPQYFTPLVRTYLAAMMRAGIPRAAAIMADSQATARQLAEVLAIPAERVTVTPIGVAERFRPATDEERARVVARYGLDGPYLIYVGGINPRKNVARLVRAYAQARRAHHLAQRLLVVGRLGWQYDDVLEAIREADLGEAIQMLGHAPTDDIAPLIAGADALAYPSLEEGFGLPVVEAMACGTPALTSATSSTGEIGGEAALLVDPTSEQAIADGLARLCGDPALRERMRAAGLNEARRYSWSHVAETAIALYRRLAAARHDTHPSLAPALSGASER